jgi:hypothetical protein
MLIAASGFLSIRPRSASAAITLIVQDPTKAVEHPHGRKESQQSLFYLKMLVSVRVAIAASTGAIESARENVDIIKPFIHNISTFSSIKT